MRVNRHPENFFILFFLFFALISRAFSQSQDAEVLFNKRTVEVFSDGTMTTTTFRKILIHTENGKKRFTQLAMGINPELDEIKILRLYKSDKNGTTVDVPPESTPLKENYTGIQSHKILIPLPQAEVGETLGYEIQTHRKKPLFKKHYWNMLNLQEEFPVKESMFEVKIPSGFPFYYQILSQGGIIADSRTKTKAKQAFLNPVITKTKTHTTYTWTIPEMPALKLENLYADGVRIVAGSTKDWKEIAQWFSESYDAASLPTQAVKEKVVALTQGTKTKDDAIQKIFRYASQYISYFSEELGVGALLPRNADVVLSDRRGDCKDKTALLLSMLKVLNVAAYPVLVNTNANLDFKNLLPAPYYFNHVLLALPDKNGSYVFVDPTLTDVPFTLDPMLHAKPACILSNGNCTFTKIP